MLNFRGTLDGSGQATATLNSMGPIDTSLAGFEVWFAFVLMCPMDYASNAVPIEILPEHRRLRRRRPSAGD